MSELSPEETGRRIAAARAYSGLGLDELALRLEISAPTLRRWCAGDERSLGRGHQLDTKIKAVIAETSCPPEFFNLESNGPDDYREMEKSPAFRHRLWRIEQRLEKLESKRQECGCGGDCSCK